MGLGAKMSPSGAGMVTPESEMSPDSAFRIPVGCCSAHSRLFIILLVLLLNRLIIMFIL